MAPGSRSAARIVVGLGNPGAAYERTPHNLGFRVVDTLAARWKVGFHAGPGSFWWTKPTRRSNAVLVKPVTYMNRSGEAVTQIIETIGLPLEDLLVVCDDVQLPFGKIRLRRGGGDGGHKGLESIIYHTSSEEFPRLRIGIGGGENPEQWIEQVLSPFGGELEPKISDVIDTASDAVECWIRDGIETAMNRFNATSLFDEGNGTTTDVDEAPGNHISE
jgi:PTH1 family peptidyl-tRNA hydrolase